MRTLIRFAAATMLLASSATMALAQNSGKNDSVDYAPRVQTVAGILPLADQYTLAVSAPTQMNNKAEAALKDGLVASCASTSPHIQTVPARPRRRRSCRSTTGR